MLIRNYRHLVRGLYLSRNRLIASGTFPLPNGHVGSAFLVRFVSQDARKKLEETLRILKEDIEKQNQTDQEKQLQLVKEPLHQRVMNTLTNPKSLLPAIWAGLMHTCHGFMLFFYEIRISSKYVLKMRNQSLNRKERQQLIRTFADIVRMIPFSIFIIVPCMEFLLPFYIKLFPQMIPSTFDDHSKQDKKNLTQMRAKIEMAKFLQDTLEEIGMSKKKKEPDGGGTLQTYEFSQFLKKVREEGGKIDESDLFKYIKLFQDELTLDKLSMSQLRALCGLLGISKLGSPEILRFWLKMNLRELKSDDKMIIMEGGVEVLSVQELQAACKARGMRAYGLSEKKLQTQLKQWLELSLNDQVPPSLLLLSRVMYFPMELNFSQRLTAIIASLPEEIGEHTIVKLKELESISDPKARIKLLKSIEAKMAEERKEEKQRAKEEAAATEAQAKAEKTEEVAEPAVTTIEQSHEHETKEAETKKVETKETEINAQFAEESIGAVPDAVEKEKDGAKKDKEKLDSPIPESFIAQEGKESSPPHHAAGGGP